MDKREEKNKRDTPKHAKPEDLRWVPEGKLTLCNRGSLGLQMATLGNRTIQQKVLVLNDDNLRHFGEGVQRNVVS